MSPQRQPTNIIEHSDDPSAAELGQIIGGVDGPLGELHASLGPQKDDADRASEDALEFSSIQNEMDGRQIDMGSRHSPAGVDSGKPLGLERTGTTTEYETQSGHDVMESSTATLMPDAAQSARPSSGQSLCTEEQIYLDPTPKTPLPSQPPSRSPSSAASIPHYSRATEAPERSPTRSDSGFDEKPSASEDERETNSRSEIQSIMEQFSEDGQGPGHEEVMSPRLEFAGPLLSSPIQHPPRKSSLEPLNASNSSISQSMQDLRVSSSTSLSVQSLDHPDVGPIVPPKPGSIRSFGQQSDRYQHSDSPMSPALHRPPPPDPEPEPDLPFDFHRFLEQLRHKTADPVAKFLRSFLTEFGKKQWMVHEQVKIIGDFLAFITNKMAQCEVWREVSDAEFDNAREGMEKLVMNRLYTQTFSPAIPPPQPIPGTRPKRRGAERPMGPGRRGQHQEDVERDEVLAQKVSIYGWVKEEHLDIPAVGDSGKRFLVLAQAGMFYNKMSLLKLILGRAPKNQDVQSASRQNHMCTKLLQGHIW
jgi:Rab5 GDP/GTP exchange factor